MTLIKALFWISLFIAFYAYIGYGILIYILVLLKRATRKNKVEEINSTFEPEVSLIIAAFNEEDFIAKKIQNTLDLHYDRQKLKIIFITDGSTDATADIIKQYSEFELLHESQRKGKVAAMNRAMQFVKTPYVIFSDANTLLNTDCVKEIVKHYKNIKVGGVAGEKKIITTANDKAATVGEGIYWKYESFLKKMDSEFYSVVGAAGELFSLRTNLFDNIREDAIIEDFVLSLKVCMDGYVIRYEPNAYAMETSSQTMKEEEKRKVRICAGAFQAMVILKGLFNVFKYPILSFQFISHRILRWTLCPLCLVTLVASNLIIIINERDLFYEITLALQGLFYVMGFIGRLYANKNIMVKILYVPYYFLFMNLSVFLGFDRFLKKKQSVLWEKSSRHKI